jgi:hypothetical protein
MPLKDDDKRREYHRTYMQTWYVDNQDTHKARVKASRDKRLAERLAKLNALKSVPCMDCGNCYDSECMDFDHRPGVTKVRDVAVMARNSPWDQVLLEIEKCDVVCANCHRLRTKHRRSGLEEFGTSPGS